VLKTDHMSGVVTERDHGISPGRAQRRDVTGE
jgi:hypothetical protein